MSGVERRLGDEGILRGWRATVRCCDWSMVGRLASSCNAQGELWLSMALPPAVGTSVELKVVLPDATTFTARGVVRCTVTSEEALAIGSKAGMRTQLKASHARVLSLLGRVAPERAISPPCRPATEHGMEGARPLLVVVGRNTVAGPLSELFARRGFTLRVFASVDGLRRLPRPANMAVAAVIDLELTDAAGALAVLRGREPGLPIVGIAGDSRVGDDVEQQVDAVFVPPVDPARLFVRVVALVAERKRGKGAPPRISGVVGTVKGNPLFEAACRELHDAVSPVNAAAILERALAELGANPSRLSAAELDAILGGGHLARALAAFSEPASGARVVGRIKRMIPR